MIESLLRDLRFAVRSLAKSPGFVAVAVVTLGLALALTTTTFGILDAVRRPYLPIKDLERVFTVQMWRDRNRASNLEMFRTLRDGARFYEDIAIYSARRVNVQVSDTAGLRGVTVVSDNLYQLLGFRAELGRLFATGTPAAIYENSVVVSYDIWATALGRRSLGSLTLTIDGRSHDVIGVLPPGVEYPYGEVFMTLPRDDEARWRSFADAGFVAPIVRLKKGTSREEAEAKLSVLEARLNATYGVVQVPFDYKLRELAVWHPAFKPIHFAMAGAALLVLLIACANLASLMLARGVVKRRELALRLALGARRGTLVRQLVSEGGVLALGGGALGIVLSVWALDVVAHEMPPTVRSIGLLTPFLSWRTFGFAFGATALTLVLFGLLPAIRASNVELSEPLKGATGNTTGKIRLRYHPLVIAQVACALVLLMGTALLTKSAVQVANYPFGYETRGLLSAGVTLGPTWSVPDSARRLVHGILDHIRSRDSVSAVAGAFWVLPEEYTVVSDDYDGERGFFLSEGVPVVTPDFLRTLGIPVVQGRDFLPGDDEAGAVIVEQDAVPHLWRGGDVIGRMIKLGDAETNAPWLRVVGVARKASLGFKSDPDLPDRFGMYVASRHYTSGRYSFVMRVRGSEAVAALNLQREIRAILPPKGVIGGWVRRWSTDWERRLDARFFLVRVFSAFSVFALALAAIGVYGVLAYTVSQRLREFAIRVALGAEKSRVVRLVLHDGLVMLLAGTGIGAFLAMWGARVLNDWLYRVFYTDAPSLVTAEIVLVVTGLAACIVPAIRATRADPVEILRAT
jgi:predicted permease